MTDLTPPPPVDRKPFAPQAAAFSLCALPVAAAVAYAVRTTDPGLRQNLFLLAEAVVGVGLLLGVAAVVAGRRSRSTVVVARVGTLLDAAAVAALCIGVVRGPGPDPKRMHGHWYRSVATPAGLRTDVVTLEANGDASEVSFGGGLSGSVTDWSGRWRLDDRRLVVTIGSSRNVATYVDADRTYGTVDSVTGGPHGELALTIRGTKTYFTHDPTAGPDPRQTP